jgi:hypothetical protein
MERDFFICHASEDKAEVVRPLVKAFLVKNILCWVDEAEIRWGDSITQKVNEGLRISRYVIVVLSKSSINKNWPMREMYAVMNQEAASGEVKILPLLVGDRTARENIMKQLPLLGDKTYLIWNGNPESIVEEAINRLSGTQEKTSDVKPYAQSDGPEEDIPMPRIRKKFTQQEKDQLIKDTFSTIEAYFQRALLRIEQRYSQVKTDFTEIHATKFIAKIYVQGETKCQCKIWIGGLFSADSIAYSENRVNIDSDNAFNELVSVEDDGFETRLRFSMGVMTPGPKVFHNPSEAAEALWKRFVTPLEYL